MEETNQTRANVTRESVLSAMGEFDTLGRDAFLSKHGYRRSNSYKVTHEGRTYDSKAVLGVAFGYEYGCPSLRPSEFSGGVEHCAKLFMKLGFTMTRDDETLTEKMVKGVARLVRRVGKTVAAMVATVTTLVVGLVSCTKSKLPKEGGPYRARDLYTPSWNYRQMVKYLEDVRQVDEWFVLSAKHGLVDPDEMVEWYNDTLSGAPMARKREWGAEVQAALQARYEGRPVKFVLMAGRDYSECVTGIEDAMDATVEKPMAGLGKGVGPRRTWLGQFA